MDDPDDQENYYDFVDEYESYDPNEQDVGDEYYNNNEDESYSYMNDPNENEVGDECDMNNEDVSYSNVNDEDEQEFGDECEKNEEDVSYSNVNDEDEQEFGDECENNEEDGSYSGMIDEDEQVLGGECEENEEDGSYSNINDEDEQEFGDECVNNEEDGTYPDMNDPDEEEVGEECDNNDEDGLYLNMNDEDEQDFGDDCENNDEEDPHLFMSDLDENNDEDEYYVDYGIESYLDIGLPKKAKQSVDALLPPEIRRMDEKSQQLYRDALRSGKERVYNIRLMVIGHNGVGKTSLVKRLLGEEVRENDTESTVGIDVHATCCHIDHATRKWNRIETNPKDSVTQSMAQVMHEHVRQKRLHHSANNQAMETKEVMKTETDANVLEGEECLAEKKMCTNINKAYGPEKEPSNVLKVHNRMESGNVNEITDFNKIKHGLHIGIPLPSSITNASNKEISEFVENAQYMTLPSNLSSSLTILDFAGQFLYYTTHQTFMSRRTIYLLVTDMSLKLTNSVKDYSSGMDVIGKKLDIVQDYVIYWLNSVHSHSFLPAELSLEKDMGKKDQNLPDIHRRIPPVILVGTNCDKIPKSKVEKKTKKHFDEIRRLLHKRPLRYYLVDEFAVSNIQPDSTIDKLKMRIFELAQSQDYWGQEIPARWLALRKALIEKREKEGKMVVEYNEVESLNKSLEVKIESNEELDLFLEFEHQLGNVIFYRIKELRAEVILDPQWLIKGLKIWITSDEIVKKYPDLEGDWYRFKDTGQLTKTLIDLLWSMHSEFHQHQQHLLDVMEKLNILAKPIVKDPEAKDDNYYWVPCMVQKSADDYHQKREGVTKTPTLCFVSQTKFIHVGVFHRLLASCLSKWQPAKIGKKFLLFNGICEFELDGCHNLVLSINDYIIQAAVIRYSTEEEGPELAYCIIVQEYVYSALKAIAECLCPSCGFEMCIQCDKSPPQSNEGLHKITDLRKVKDTRCSSHKDGTDHCVTSHELLRFWEREDLSIPCSVQTAQSNHVRNNFMKVFSLVVDVGSKVLRRLLIFYTVTPNCTLDQYLKSQKKPIADLKKRSVLRKDQIDILFPQKGSTDLSKYDITLASALLCNIVPALDQQDEPKVKGLRQERNNLMHATSTEMNVTEFKIKWTNITTALTDLVRCFQDTDFEKEIQRAIMQIDQPGVDYLESILNNYRDMKDRLEKLEHKQERKKREQMQLKSF